ncbi:MAG TPA: cytochrome c [Kiloniellales bacterium]|jgi:mono/diheme cytochrome c family protein|nr:cytochrome c [Kiloniellales bacterium]
MRQLCALSLVAVGAGIAAAGAQAEDTLQRGAYLVNTVMACGNCHTSVGPAGPGPELAGGLPFELPSFTTYAANLTPDRKTGIGDWSDQEIGRAIREGIGRDGRLLAPVMPAEFFQHLSDQDLAAVISYLRQLEPVRNEVPPSIFRMPLPVTWVEPITAVAEPDRSDPVAYGAYLGQIAHCMECHTPRDDQGHLDLARLGAGQHEFIGPWGVSVSANITPNAETGIGGWSDAEIKRAITEGISRNGYELRPPMAFSY